MADIISFSDKWNGPSFLNRKPSALRMAEREEAGKLAKKHNKQQKMKHADEDFWKEWENENQ